VLPSLRVMEDFKIHSYTAAEPGLFVNNCLLETGDGVVLAGASPAAGGLRIGTHSAGPAESHADSRLYPGHGSPGDASLLLRQRQGAPLGWMASLGAHAVAVEIAA